MKEALSMLLWIPALLIKFALMLAGLVIVPIALLTQRMSLRKGHTVDHDHWPDLFWLWGNDEDGVPKWWYAYAANGKAGKVAEWFPQFWWYAIRNPANNVRFLFEDVDLSECHVRTNWDINIPMEAQQLRDAGQGMAYYVIRHGWKSGYRRVWLNPEGRYGELWIGWKLASGVPGLGFTSQVRLKRKIGT